MSALTEMGKRAKEAAVVLATLPSPRKNKALLASADALLAAEKEILAANAADVAAAEAAGVKGAFIDRLTLTVKRLAEMADGLRQVAALDDPVGEMLSMKTLDNGLIIGQKRVPMGVIGIIFEARPNVAADAFGLCLKGGSDALKSNRAIVECIRRGLVETGIPGNALQLIESTDRESTRKFMCMDKYLDVLIPRGGAGLIRSVVENSTVPVIQTGVGNCHIYVDESADLEKAVRIVLNAKTQRPGVCNACESLLVHEAVAEKFLPAVGAALREKKVEIRGDEQTLALIQDAVPATEEDWATEYEDLILSARVVRDFDEAAAHIRRYSTGHSEAIITENYTNAQRFLNEVDAAAVYVNASTRFTDGGQFGFGAEIGISTQKLHARGPMGLKEMTTTKYIIYGSGQIRE